MVRILSSGEIVPDDDPRAQQGGSRGGSAGQGDGRPRPRQGQIQHDDSPQGQQNYGGQGAGGLSIFDGLNQRLAEAGVPRWNLGPYTVEPIASAGFLLALLFMGLRGLLFAGLLFFVVKYSQGAGGGGGGGGRGGAPGGGQGWQSWLGGGAGGQEGGGGPSGGPGQGGGGSGRSTGGSWRGGGGHRLGR